MTKSRIIPVLLTLALIASVCIGETFAAGEVAFIISENSDQMCKMPKATQIAATITKARKESSRLS